MEELPNTPDSDERISGRRSRRRSAGDFLQSYLLRRTAEKSPEDEPDEEEEDDDDEEETEGRYRLTRRFRRSFRRLRNLGGLVEAQPVAKNEEPRPVPSGPDRTESTATPELAPDTGTEFQQQPLQQQAAGPEAGNPESIAAEPEDQSGQSSIGSEPSGSRRPERRNLVSPEMKERRIPNEAPPLLPPPLERTVYERISDTETAAITSVDPQARALAGTGLVAAGLESLGRRKQDRKIMRQVDTLNQKNQQDRQRLDRLEQTTPGSDMNRLDVWQQAFERSPSPIASLPKAEQYPANTAGNAPAAAKHATEVKLEQFSKPDQPLTAEKIISEAKRSEQKAEFKSPEVEKLLHQSETKLPPDAVREEVEVAAVKNMPLERLYERRHEIKDDPSAAAAAAQAAAAGGGTGFKPQVSAPVFAAPALSTDEIPKAPAPLLAGARMYRNAVLNGLWGAVIVLLIIAVSSVMN